MASANPWEQASQALELALYPPLTSAFWTQLDLLRWIYGLGVLLGVAGTLIRIQRNNIWLFRVEKGREGCRIVPQTAVMFVLFAALFCGWYRDRGDQRNIVVWRGLPCGSYFAMWGVLSATTLQDSSNQLLRPTSTRIVYRRRSAAPIPRLCAFVPILSPALAIATIATPFFIANASFNVAIDASDELSAILKGAAASWNGTVDNDITLQLAEPSARIMSARERLTFAARIGCVMYLFWAIVFLVGLGLGARSVATQLRFQIATLERSAGTLRQLAEQQGTQASDFDPYVSAPPQGHAETLELKARELRRALTQLGLQAFFYVAGMGGYFAIIITVLIKPEGVATDPTIFSAVTLGALWTYAILGIPGLAFATYVGFASRSGSFIGTPPIQPRPPPPRTDETREEEDEWTQLELRKLGISTPFSLRSTERIPQTPRTPKGFLEKGWRMSMLGSAGSEGSGREGELRVGNGEGEEMGESGRRWKPSEWTRET